MECYGSSACLCVNEHHETSYVHKPCLKTLTRFQIKQLTCSNTLGTVLSERDKLTLPTGSQCSRGFAIEWRKNEAEVTRPTAPTKDSYQRLPGRCYPSLG